MTTYVKVSGTWRTVTGAWTRQGGSWRELTNIYAHTAGAWRETHSGAPPAPTLSTGTNGTTPMGQGGKNYGSGWFYANGSGFTTIEWSLTIPGALSWIQSGHSQPDFTVFENDPGSQPVSGPPVGVHLNPGTHTLSGSSGGRYLTAALRFFSSGAGSDPASTFTAKARVHNGGGWSAWSATASMTQRWDINEGGCSPCGCSCGCG